ncbi:MAG TPA: hypothetical protein VMI54_08020 [Polyangiaceae bacterium]|nr:hypothetical protein [Polyangiaceae bacterium]
MVTERRRQSGWARAAALVFAAGVACNTLVGIDKPNVVDQERCAASSDCSNKTYLCVAGLCSSPCTGDADCPQNLRCLKVGDGSTSACVAGSSVQCHDEGDCPGVPICSKGECRNDCVDDPSSCLAGQTCGPDGACYGDPSHDPSPSGGAGGSPASGGQPGTGGTSASGGTAGGAVEAGGMSGAPGAENAGEAGKGAGGEGGAMESTPECTDEGAVRCAGHATTGRLVCDQGTLRLKDTCPDGELCDTTSDPPGQCAPVPDACRGRSPGDAFCDGTTRSVCGPDLVSIDQTDCGSVQLCTLGTGANCAACLPNDHRCVDQTLQACKSDNTGFETISQCTDAPCNADAGACTTYACLKGQLRCNQDNLEQCKTDQSGFELKTACGAGLCDSSALECDVCVHDQKRCTDMSTVATCSSDGQSETPMACPTASPFCTGKGVCVECMQTNDCTSTMGPCYTPSCNSGTGVCEENFNQVHSPCNGTGFCAANGSCLQCLSVADCPASDDCHPAQCSSSGTCSAPAAPPNTRCNNDTGYCNSSGQCVACTDASQCGGGDACNLPACGSNGQCGTTPAGKNTMCTIGGGKYCDGNGACVPCTAASQCQASECNSATCTTSGCGQSPLAPPATCSGGSKYCDGNGNCVACFGTGQTQCSSGNVCHSNVCAPAVQTVGNTNVDTGTDSVFANTLLVCQLPALQYDATLLDFGVVGDVSSVNGRMVLYKDSGGVPSGALVAQSAGQNFPLFAGTQVEVAPSSTTVTLAANTTYWVGIVTSADTTIRRNASGTQGACKTWGQSFTQAFGSAQTGTNQAVAADMYIRVSDTD